MSIHVCTVRISSCEEFRTFPSYQWSGFLRLQFVTSVFFSDILLFTLGHIFVCLRFLGVWAVMSLAYLEEFLQLGGSEIIFIAFFKFERKLLSGYFFIACFFDFLVIDPHEFRFIHGCLEYSSCIQVFECMKFSGGLFFELLMNAVSSA